MGLVYVYLGISSSYVCLSEPGWNFSLQLITFTRQPYWCLVDDESNLLSIPNGSGSTTPAKTTWTLLLYLTSPATGCKGGETVFYPGDTFLPQKKQTAEKPVVVELETGMLLLHKHGNDCMLVSRHLFPRVMPRLINYSMREGRLLKARNGSLGVISVWEDKSWPRLSWRSRSTAYFFEADKKQNHYKVYHIDIIKELRHSLTAQK